jgi:putative intracellular protease/amidase/glyoxylase-like metal-dependent hydrolase (beta-lactamase superfamily II)
VTKVAVLIADAFQDSEYFLPKIEIEKLGVETETISISKNPVEIYSFFKGIGHLNIDKTIDEVRPEDYVGVLVPGGAKSPAILAEDERALSFLRKVNSAGRMIAPICRGTLLVATSGIVKDREITGFHQINQYPDLAVKPVVEKFGGLWREDKPVVISGNLISSRHPDDIESFSKAIRNWLRSSGALSENAWQMSEENSTTSQYEPVIHTFKSGEAGLMVNGYLIETSDHVVAVDSALIESAAKDLRKKFDSLGKPLAFVLITHGHPDHYNGLIHLTAGMNVDIIATPGTDRVIRESDARKEKQWSGIFGEEWPKKRTFPNRTLADGHSISIDGLTFTVHDLGIGESDSDSYWVMEGNRQRVAFIGDVVLNHLHAYAADAHTFEWLRNLDRLIAELSGFDRIYPGHGESGGVELLQWQKHYLQELRSAITALAKNNTELSDTEKAQLVEHMNQKFPDTELDFLLINSADPVAKELATERDRTEFSSSAQRSVAS